MGERSLISVVVPAWRAEKTLAATLDSILTLAHEKAPA